MDKPVDGDFHSTNIHLGKTLLNQLATQGVQGQEDQYLPNISEKNFESNNSVFIGAKKSQLSRVEEQDKKEESPSNAGASSRHKKLSSQNQNLLSDRSV